MIYPYTTILFRNYKEWTTYTCDNMDNSDNNYSDCKKPDSQPSPQKVHNESFHFCKTIGSSN